MKKKILAGVLALSALMTGADGSGNDEGLSFRIL